MDNNLAIQDTSQGMPTAQVPVNARVTAAAKQVRAAIKDVVIPDMVKILQNDKTPVETRTKVHKMLIDYHLGLENMTEKTKTERMALELNAFGKMVKARDVTPDDEDDDTPRLSNDIIDV